MRSPTGIGDFPSPLLSCPSFARHSFSPANKFAAPRKDPPPAHSKQGLLPSLIRSCARRGGKDKHLETCKTPHRPERCRCPTGHPHRDRPRGGLRKGFLLPRQPSCQTSRVLRQTHTRSLGAAAKSETIKCRTLFLRRTPPDPKISTSTAISPSCAQPSSLQNPGCFPTNPSPSSASFPPSKSPQRGPIKYNKA